jgi:hypothetical protein
MRVVCSWCRHEGRSGDLGEKAPFDDAALTHAICARHLEQLLSTLPSPSCPGVDVLVVVHRRDLSLHDYLARTIALVRGVKVLVERRQYGGDRRRASGAVSQDRRHVERRVRRGVSLPGCTLVRFKRRA